MNKGISLDVTLKAPAGQTADDVLPVVQSTVGGQHNGLNIQVLGVRPADADHIQAMLFVQGDQSAAESFTQVTTDLVRQLWFAQTGLEAAAPQGVAPLPQLVAVEETENYDAEGDTPLESGGLEAAGPSRRRCIAAATTVGAVVGVGLHTLAADKARPAPQAATFNQCPPAGENGSDSATNLHKNRIDEGHWQPATVAAILALNAKIPPNLGRRRTTWKPADGTAIAHYEGLPLQVEGYLAGVSGEGPESCNCHSLDDLDFHSWLVDAPGQTRDHSVVIEFSPRVRANHAAWTIENLCRLVQSAALVRVSGWLMLDPEHPDQVGKTRGTIWEIHPVMQIEVQQNNAWVALDAADFSGLESAPFIESVPLIE